MQTGQQICMPDFQRLLLSKACVYLCLCMYLWDIHQSCQYFFRQYCVVVYSFQTLAALQSLLRHPYKSYKLYDDVFICIATYTMYVSDVVYLLCFVIMHVNSSKLKPAYSSSKALLYNATPTFTTEVHHVLIMCNRLNATN